MRVTVDTAHDSHEDIKKVIRMLQNLVGDSQEIFTNQPSQETAASPMANILGDISAQPEATAPETAQTDQETQETQAEEASESPASTEDLFAELFSEEELKKMETTPAKDEEKEEHEEEEELPKAKSKKYSIEFY